MVAPAATARGPMNRSVSMAEKPKTPPGSSDLGRLLGHVVGLAPQQVHPAGDDHEHLVGPGREGVEDELAVGELLDLRLERDLTECVGTQRVERRVLGEESREIDFLHAGHRPTAHVVS